MTSEAYWIVGAETLALTVNLPTDVVVEIVEHGIVEPEGPEPAQWQFDTDMLAQVKKAHQLYCDLAVDWAGVAIAMALLSQVDELKRENALLKSQLARFVE